MTNADQHESDLPKISQPAVRALASIGCYRLDQVAKVSERELRVLHGMGPKAIGILRDALAERGLAFNEQPSGRGAP